MTMQNYNISDFVQGSMEDPVAERILAEYMQAVNLRGLADPKLRDDCIMWGSFSRGVEYGAAAAFRALLRMSQETAEALASVRSILPVLGDDEHKHVSAVLTKAYEATRDGREMAKYLALRNSSALFGIPQEMLKKFLDAPQPAIEYVRIGMLGSQVAQEYFLRFLIVHSAGAVSTLECKCSACIKNAAWGLLSENSKLVDVPATVDPVQGMEAFGRLIIELMRDAIDSVDRGDVRTGHDEGEPGKTAEDLLNSLFGRSRGE